uniref:Uncharacterized protein n=1 Tax=Seriola lalandi dorsalis TaxID=1841481 RepID=A0A3B4WQ04_SERLL
MADDTMFHVCLHFIYCFTCCCRHSGYKASLGCYYVIVRVAAGQHGGSTSLLDRCVLTFRPAGWRLEVKPFRDVGHSPRTRHTHTSQFYQTKIYIYLKSLQYA